VEGGWYAEGHVVFVGRLLVNVVGDVKASMVIRVGLESFPLYPCVIRFRANFSELGPTPNVFFVTRHFLGVSREL
jgi:hypothetical protein